MVAALALGALLLTPGDAAAPGTIITVAGGSLDDGSPATSTVLAYPEGVAVDSTGRLYIVDGIRCRVREVSGGIITTVAGGSCGYWGDGGTATSAAFAYPTGLTLDGAGRLYVADNYNCRVRQVSDSMITTVAGNGSCGYAGDGGPATSAALQSPAGVAVDGAGNLYIADADDCRVRKVSGGIITTIAGNGTCGYSGDDGQATSAGLNYPRDVALDGAGNLYIADLGNCRVRRVSGGIITTVAGNGTCGYSGDNGPATNAAISYPTGLTLDGYGQIYIADNWNCRVRKVSGEIITTVAGKSMCGYSGDGGFATNATLSFPSDVALDDAGNLYITDNNNCRLRKVSGGIITTVAGNGSCSYSGDGGPATAATLSLFYGVTVGGGGNLYIADSDNCRVREVSGGIITTVAGNGDCSYSGDGGPATSATLHNPRDVATDGAGNVYIADVDNCVVRKVSGGIITTVFGNGGCIYASPQDVAVDAADNLYVLDRIGCQVWKAGGGITRSIVGNGSCTYSGDGGPATSAGLRDPKDLALDGAGNLYITETWGCRVREVSGGIITTVAGNGSCQYSEDGTPAPTLYFPDAVAVDGAGNLYIAESADGRVRKVSDGIITTVAGNGNCGSCPLGDGGPATSAALNPHDVALDGAGNLFIADTYNHRVREVIAAPVPVGGFAAPPEIGTLPARTSPSPTGRTALAAAGIAIAAAVVGGVGFRVWRHRGSRHRVG